MRVVSMNVADLVATMRTDDSAFERGVDGAERQFDRLARQLAATARRAEQETVIEPTVDTSEAESELDSLRQDADRAAERASDAAVIEPTVDEGEAESALDGLAGMAAVAGAAAAVAFGAAFVGGLEEERVGDRIGAQLGGDRAFDSAKYGAMAGRLYAQAYGESVAEVGDAITAVATSIKGLDDAGIESATAQALDLASAFGVDVTRAVQTVGTLLNTGLAKNADEAFDLVVAASQRVPAHLREDVMDASDEYAQFFKSLGFSGEQAFALLVKGSEKGMFGIDKMGDSIKEATLLMTDIGNTGVTDAYKAIGLDATKTSNAILAGGNAAQTAFQQIITGLLKIKDPSAQAAAAIALFGTPLEDMNKTEIPEFLKSLQAGEQGMAGFAGESKNLGKTLNDNAATQIEMFKRTIMAGLSDAGTAVLLPIVKIATAIGSALGPVLERGAQLWQKYEGWLKPVGVFLGTLVGIIATVIAIQKVWMAVQAAHTAIMAVWNATLLANPIGLIIVAVVALVAALVYAYKTSETFRNVVQTVWQAIVAVVTWAWENVIKPYFTAMGAVLSWLGQFFMATFNLIKYLIQTVFAPAIAGMGIALQWVWQNIIKPTIDIIWGAIQWVVDKIAGAWSKIAGPVGAAFNVVTGIIKGAINAVIGLINTATRFINSALSKANNLPGVNFPMIPAIPKLATGGKVAPSPGGRPVIMGDGGEVEYGIPHSDMQAIIAQAVRAGAGGGGGVLEVRFTGEGLMRGIRQTARVQGGRSRGAQTVLVGA